MSARRVARRVWSGVWRDVWGGVWGGMWGGVWDGVWGGVWRGNVGTTGRLLVALPCLLRGSDHFMKVYSYLVLSTSVQ